MKNIMNAIKRLLKNLGNDYLEAMEMYGEAIGNSRGLVGA